MSKKDLIAFTIRSQLPEGPIEVAHGFCSGP